MLTVTKEFGIVTDCESDSGLFGVSKHRASHNPDASMRLRTFRGFFDLQKDCLTATFST